MVVPDYHLEKGFRTEYQDGEPRRTWWWAWVDWTELNLKSQQGNVG